VDSPPPPEAVLDLRPWGAQHMALVDNPLG
jgi:hypothetical protein